MSAETTSVPTSDDPPPPSASTPVAEVTPAVTKPIPWRRIAIIAVVIIILALGAPALQHSFRFVSTDDAYVNSYVTFVAPRVAGQVEKVFVEDNNRVKKGDILVQLDPEPYEVKVAIKQESDRNNLISSSCWAQGITEESHLFRQSCPTVLQKTVTLFLITASLRIIA